jgi:hypothetical protein
MFIIHFGISNKIDAQKWQFDSSTPISSSGFYDKSLSTSYINSIQNNNYKSMVDDEVEFPKLTESKNHHQQQQQLKPQQKNPTTTRKPGPKSTSTPQNNLKTILNIKRGVNQVSLDQTENDSKQTKNDENGPEVNRSDSGQ